jgi:hypothetical protein
MLVPIMFRVETRATRAEALERICAGSMYRMRLDQCDVRTDSLPAVRLHSGPRTGISSFALSDRGIDA